MRIPIVDDNPPHDVLGYIELKDPTINFYLTPVTCNGTLIAFALIKKEVK